MKTKLEIFAELIEMTVEHLREAADNIRRERMKNNLLAKVQLIRDRNTAILPTGEIVPRGTPGAIPYETTP